MILGGFWAPDATTLQFTAPELLLVATVACVLLAAVALGRAPKTLTGIAIAGVLVSAAAAWTQLGSHAGPVELFVTDTAPGVMIADRLAAFFRVFVLLFLAAILAIWPMFDARRAPAEFLTLLLCSAVGMSLMSSATNLIVMILAIEMASLPSYALVAFDRRSRIAAEAGIKYALFGAICAGLTLYGASLLYGITGSLHLPTIAERISDGGRDLAATPLLAVALLCTFVGVGFKISAVPLHFWCPDAFQGASLPIATWLSVASKAAGLVLLLRLVGLMGGADGFDYRMNVLPGIAWTVAVVAALTCTFANLAAFHQTNVRRLLAYSSIAHAGYMLCAGAIVAPGGSAEALSALLQYLVIYLFMNLGAFTALGLVASDSGSEELDAFRGLGWRDPPLAAALTLCLVSLIGLPPLGGFIAKWWLIWALSDAASSNAGGLTTVLWTLVFVVVLNTALSLFYYARIIRDMYLRGDREAARPLSAPLAGKLLVQGCAVALLLTGVLTIGPLKRNADAVAAASVGRAPSPSAAAVAGNDDH